MSTAVEQFSHDSQTEFFRDNMRAIIGCRIQRARDAARLSIGDLHDAGVVSRAFLYNLEAGRVDVSIGKLAAIASAVNRPVEWFFRPVRFQQFCPHCDAEIGGEPGESSDMTCGNGHVFPASAAVVEFS